MEIFTVMLALLLIIIAIFAGLYMAWNIGANDVANSMSTAVGAKAITLRQALLIASVLNFLGAVLVGKHVTDTIQKGILNIYSSGGELALPEHSIMLGFLGALLSAGIFVTLATWKELPVSTTHAVIGGVIGFGLVQGGIELVKWKTVGMVATSWILSPLVGGIIAFTMFKIIAYFVLATKEPVKSAKKAGPVFIGLTIFIIFLSIFMKTRMGDLLGYDLKTYIFLSFLAGFVASVAGIFILKKTKGRGYDIVEGLFRRLQIMTSCYVAFSHGANDVANAVAPVGIVLALAWGKIDTVYLLALGGVGIAVGITTWGYKVIRTVGGKITALTNTRGFAIDFSAATVVLVASKLGMPISTTHTVVGAVIGVGLARGLDAVDLSVIKRIIYSWLLTLPAAAIIAILIYRGLLLIF
ncbi:MAG TPA: inorganic phosphate transporter [Thermoplasmatales archaeon]|nr:inorganic phosphate transporter [Thermoplasmatales archaeon]